MRTNKTANSFTAAIIGNAYLEEGIPAYRLIEPVQMVLVGLGFRIAVVDPQTIERPTKHRSRNQSDSILIVSVGKPIPSKDAYDTFFPADRRVLEKLNALLLLSDIVIGLPGGIQTLRDIFYIWYVNKYSDVKKPLFLIGDEWVDFRKIMEENSYVSSADLMIYNSIPHVEDLRRLLKEWIESRSNFFTLP